MVLLSWCISRVKKHTQRTFTPHFTFYSYLTAQVHQIVMNLIQPNMGNLKSDLAHTGSSYELTAVPGKSDYDLQFYLDLKFSGSSGRKPMIEDCGISGWKKIKGGPPEYLNENGYLSAYKVSEWCTCNCIQLYMDRHEYVTHTCALVHTCTCTHTHPHTRICTDIRTYTCMYLHTPAHPHACTHTCLCRCMHTHMLVHMHAHAHAHAHAIHALMYTYTHLHAHLRMHTCTPTRTPTNAPTHVRACMRTYTHAE